MDPFIGKDPMRESVDEDGADYVLQDCLGADTAERVDPSANSLFGRDDDLAHDLPSGWTLEKFQQRARSLVREYFESLELGEAIRGCGELFSECPTPTDELVVVALRLALQRGDAQRRSCVTLLCKLNEEEVVDSTALVRGFEKVICAWEEEAKDAPLAPKHILLMLDGCLQHGCVAKVFACRLPENLIKVGLGEGEELQEMLTEVNTRLKKFKPLAARCLDEFFSAAKVAEIETFLTELKMQSFHHEFVKKAIALSFSQSSPVTARESVLAMLTQLGAAGVVTRDDVLWGITRLLSQLDDLSLDCPRAVVLATEFLSGLVAEELVSAPFVRRCRLLRIGGPTALKVLDATQRKTPEYSKRQLDTAQFKRELETMIIEYFNSTDKAEFGRCVRELAPWSESQSAELIRKIMHFAIERSGNECEAVLDLMVWLCRNEEIDSSGVEAGFDELYTRMGDISLDVPDAREMAASFVVEAQKLQLLRQEWKVPGKEP